MADIAEGRSGRPNGMEADAYAGARGTPRSLDGLEVLSVLHGCSPNPASDEALITFSLGGDERSGDVRSTTLTVYDIRGRVVRTVLNDQLPAGRHEIRWNLREDTGDRVAAGCYVYALTSGSEVLRGKLLVVN